jgi:hypothetical protein
MASELEWFIHRFSFFYFFLHVANGSAFDCRLVFEGLAENDETVQTASHGAVQKLQLVLGTLEAPSAVTVRGNASRDNSYNYTKHEMNLTTCLRWLGSTLGRITSGKSPRQSW